MRGLLLPFEAAALAAPRARDDAQCEAHDAADDDARDGAVVRLAAVRIAFISRAVVSSTQGFVCSVEVAPGALFIL